MNTKSSWKCKVWTHKWKLDSDGLRQCSRCQLEEKYKPYKSGVLTIEDLRGVANSRTVQKLWKKYWPLAILTPILVIASTMVDNRVCFWIGLTWFITFSILFIRAMNRGIDEEMEKLKREDSEYT